MVAGMRDHPRPHGIEFDIAAADEKIRIAVDGRRAIAMTFTGLFRRFRLCSALFNLILDSLR